MTPLQDVSHITQVCRNVYTNVMSMANLQAVFKMTFGAPVVLTVKEYLNYLLSKP